jgi:16S rRNA (cytidine1402-2'-O)-methyltransferase
VSLIAAEDTRETGKLLAAHGIRTPQQAYHEHNEEIRTPVLLRQLGEGASIALVSDAGTPTVSDPGYRLIRAAAEGGVPVVPIPGVSAALAALSVSGLPTDRFYFVGFLPKKAGQRMERLRSLAHETATMVFFESPRRIVGLLAAISQCFGKREAVLGREMTKSHEEFIRGELLQITEILRGRPAVKGECTLLVGGSTGSETWSDDMIDAAISEGIAAGKPASAAARELAKASGIRRSEIYDRIIRISASQETPAAGRKPDAQQKD